MEEMDSIYKVRIVTTLDLALSKALLNKYHVKVGGCALLVLYLLYKVHPPTFTGCS